MPRFELELLLNGIPEYVEFEAEDLNAAEEEASRIVAEFVQWTVTPLRVETAGEAEERLRAA